MKNIAIISPNQNAYSETFIKAHKNLLKGNIHFLYGGTIPTHSDKFGCLYMYYQKNNIKNKILKLLPVFIHNRLIKKYSNSDYLKYYLKKEKINIILAEYGVLGAENLDVIKELNIKLIVHFHGYDASVKKILEKYKEKYKQMFDYAKYVIVVSNIMKNNLENLSCPPEKIVLNTCGPNNKFFNVESKFSNKQFIAIGRFVDKKAPYYLILAFQIIVKKYSDAKLIIAGDGLLLNSCENLIKHYKLENNVYLPGVILPEKYMEYLENSLAFVQHSITADNGDMEGTPVAVLEASAAGLPVISTKHAGIPDVIIDGETGLLIEEHDVEGMAKNMIKLLNNPNLAKKLGDAGRKRIKENFTMDKHISTIQKLIDSK